nr:hypothetical protein [Syntrophales bacterium]
NLLVKTVLGSLGRLDGNLIYGRREVTSNYASFASFTKIDIDTVGATPRYILDRKLFGFDNKLTVGFDFYQDKLDKDTFADRSQAARTYEADLKRQTMGLYARDEFSVLKDLILARTSSWPWAPGRKGPTSTAARRTSGRGRRSSTPRRSTRGRPGRGR